MKASARMITAQYVQTMSRYNQWQNKSIYTAADKLSEDERKADRCVFFGSIHRTLSHLLWGDQIWMVRFADTPMPAVDTITASADMVSDWQDLKRQRQIFDDVILDWSAKLADEDVQGDLTWFSGSAQCEITKPLGFLIAHMFNHQTHHRGQVNAMLTACGENTDDTDLFYLK